MSSAYGSFLRTWQHTAAATRYRRDRDRAQQMASHCVVRVDGLSCGLCKDRKSDLRRAVSVLTSHVSRVMWIVVGPHAVAKYAMSPTKSYRLYFLYLYRADSNTTPPL